MYILNGKSGIKKCLDYYSLKKNREKHLIIRATKSMKKYQIIVKLKHIMIFLKKTKLKTIMINKTLMT